jgi:hypothetical protein
LAQPNGCQVFFRTPGAQYVGSVKNLSTHGAGIVLDRYLASGTEITAQLTNGCKLFSIDLEMRVVHTSTLPTGSFLVGCEFAVPLSHLTVQALVR